MEKMKRKFNLCFLSIYTNLVLKFITFSFDVFFAGKPRSLSLLFDVNRPLAGVGESDMFWINLPLS